MQLRVPCWLLGTWDRRDWWHVRVAWPMDNDEMMVNALVQNFDFPVTATVSRLCSDNCMECSSAEVSGAELPCNEITCGVQLPCLRGNSDPFAAFSGAKFARMDISWTSQVQHARKNARAL